MRKTRKSKLLSTCCCVDSVCSRFGYRFDLLDCMSEGGTFSGNCKQCR